MKCSLGIGEKMLQVVQWPGSDSLIKNCPALTACFPALHTTLSKLAAHKTGLDFAWRCMPQVNAHWQLPFIWSQWHVAFELSSNNLACRCSTILVRNRDRELDRVGCEAFVRTAPELTPCQAAEDPTAATMDHAKRHPAAEPIDQAS